MKRTRWLCLLMATALAVSSAACGGETPAPYIPAFGAADVCQAMIDWNIMQDSVEHLYEAYGPGSDRYDTCCLARVSVCGVGENRLFDRDGNRVSEADIVYDPAGELLDKPGTVIAEYGYTATPIRIEQILFAGEGFRHGEGDRFTVREDYYYYPSTRVFASRLYTTPLISGHEFFAVIEYREGWPDRQNDYQVICTYPVEPYGDIPELADRGDRLYKYPHVSEDLRELFETGERDVVPHPARESVVYESVAQEWQTRAKRVVLADDIDRIEYDYDSPDGVRHTISSQDPALIARWQALIPQIRLTATALRSVVPQGDPFIAAVFTLTFYRGDEAIELLSGSYRDLMPCIQLSRNDAAIVLRCDNDREVAEEVRALTEAIGRFPPYPHIFA